MTISADTQHSRSDYNLYEGTEVVGAPEIVLLRGTVLVDDGELVASPGVGRYVARARFGEELAGGGQPPRGTGPRARGRRLAARRRARGAAPGSGTRPVEPARDARWP